MPISAVDGCDEGHWIEVLNILEDAIGASGFSANLVSNADEVGIIHKRIIQNLYDNPIVVCDVSGKNPNVMFELGLRLAFDKPTIIIKDDQTAYSFDTSAIEHLEYPRDLRFSKIVEFKQKLTSKIMATHERAEKDGNYTTFLKHFGEFTVAKIEKKEVSSDQFILEELRNMRHAIQRFEQHPNLSRIRKGSPLDGKGSSRQGDYRYLDSEIGSIEIRLGPIGKDEAARALKVASMWPGMDEAVMAETDSGDYVILGTPEPGRMLDVEELKRVMLSPQRPGRTNVNAVRNARSEQS